MSKLPRQQSRTLIRSSVVSSGITVPSSITRDGTYTRCSRTQPARVKVFKRFDDGVFYMASMMSVECPECGEDFEIDKNEHDEGDSIDCPECGESSTIKIKKGKFKLASEKEKYYEVDVAEYS